MQFKFKCHSCNKTHTGMPSFGADAPFSYYQVAEAERERRCEIGSDCCVIDNTQFFVRGSLEIPVHGWQKPYTWGVWVSLSESSFRKWEDNFDNPLRSHFEPFFGWLNTQLDLYPNTVSLKTNVHQRDGLIRPYIELEPTDHPLAVEQREGVSVDRLAQIYAHYMHES